MGRNISSYPVFILGIILAIACGVICSILKTTLWVDVPTPTLNIRVLGHGRVSLRRGLDADRADGRPRSLSETLVSPSPGSPQPKRASGSHTGVAVAMDV